MVTLSTVQRVLGDKDGVSREKITANLTYLVDRGWIKSFERRSVRVKSSGYEYGPELGGLVDTRQETHEEITTSYRISATGIERIEGESEFRVRDAYDGINISAIGSVIVTGNGNYVNTLFSDLRHELDLLKEAVKDGDLGVAEKVAIAADIESIEAQLVKPSPNKEVITTLWGVVEKAVTAAGFIELVYKIQPFIASVMR